MKARLEVSLQKRLLTKAASLFVKGLKEMGDESKERTFNGKLQIFFFVGRDVAAKYTPKQRSRGEEGWVIDMKVVSTKWTDF